GTAGSASDQYVHPSGVCIGPDGSVFVADVLGDKVLEYAPDGALRRTVGTHGSGRGEFDYPVDVAVDSSGMVYVSDEQNSRIVVFDSTLTYVREWAAGLPGHLALDPAGQRLFTVTEPYVIAYSVAGAR